MAANIAHHLEPTFAIDSVATETTKVKVITCVFDNANGKQSRQRVPA